MPGRLPSLEEMRASAYYMPKLSHPILEQVHRLCTDMTMAEGLIAACEVAANGVTGLSELGWLYADLICALHDGETGWLAFVTGILNSKLIERDRCLPNSQN